MIREYPLNSISCNAPERQPFSHRKSKAESKSLLCASLCSLGIVARVTTTLSSSEQTRVSVKEKNNKKKGNNGKRKQSEPETSIHACAPLLSLTLPPLKNHLSSSCQTCPLRYRLSCGFLFFLFFLLCSTSPYLNFRSFEPYPLCSTRVLGRRAHPTHSHSEEALFTKNPCPGHSIPSDLLPTQSYHRSRSSLSRPPKAVFVVTFFFDPPLSSQSHPAGCEPHHTARTLTSIGPPKTRCVESPSPSLKRDNLDG